MPLTDTAIRNAKPKPKPYKLPDGKGLYIEVRPTGAKLWRYRYRIAGKENLFALGEYPSRPVPQGESDEQRRARNEGGVFLAAEARNAREAARGLVKQGKHPAHVRSATKAIVIAESENTFEAVAKEWLAKKGASWSPRNRDRVERTLKAEVFKDIGRLPIKAVTPHHILAVMQKVEARGAPTVAILIRQWCYRIFNHAIATLRVGTNPATGDIREAITRPPTKNHKPLDRTEVPALLSAIDGYGGERTTTIALHLLLLTFVRSGELRGAEWKEFDLDAAEWRIPAARMKMRAPHVVPLSTQAVALLRELKQTTGWSRLLFPNARDPQKHMASTTLNAALVRLGYYRKFSPHGFRGTASTILNEIGYRPDWIERQLAHKERNSVRAAYNQAQYLGDRAKMMQDWADLLDAMRKNKNVIPGKFGKVA